MRICVAGACGRMGRRILELAIQAEDMAIGGAFDLPAVAGTELTVVDASGKAETVRVTDDGTSAIAASDVLIDFTTPESCVENAKTAADAGKPTVIGVTGLSDVQKDGLALLGSRVAVVFAPNMSVGVSVLFKLAAETAKLLGLGYNVEIVETHHNQKQDSPSGTALRLAQGVAGALGLDYPGDVVHGRQGPVGARPSRQIGVHALRGGDVAGEHAVCFIGHGERVELVHKAHSRDNFALGALRAARFVVTAAPGLYDMQDVLGLKA